MTRDETKKLIITMTVAFPNYHPIELTATVDLWHSFLEDYEYSEASAGLAKYIATNTSGFAPTVGQVIALIRRTDAMDPLEAWALVAKAIRRSAYYAEEEFSKLPPAVQKAVGSPINLEAWSQLPTDEVHTVAQSHFIRAYRTVTEREKEDAALTESMQKFIAQTLPRIGAR